MEKLKTVVFEYNHNGEQLSCCVRQEDFDRFGTECATIHEVLKGVCDDREGAVGDFLAMYNFILQGGGSVGPTVIRPKTIH